MVAKLVEHPGAPDVAADPPAEPLHGATAFLVSLLAHLAAFLLLGLIPVLWNELPESIALVAPVDRDEEPIAVPEVPDDLHWNEQPSERLGANSLTQIGQAPSAAPFVTETPQIVSPLEVVRMVDHPILEINPTASVSHALRYDRDLVMKGSVGETVTGALGAIDRITHEILLSMEQRPTLVVWLFDQSGSLYRQRQEIHDRLDQVYRELGAIDASGHPAFGGQGDPPLLSSVVAFGESVSLRTPKPTDDVESIKRAIRDIELDESGVERVFSAVFMAAKQYQNLRTPRRPTGAPQRNVLLVVFIDEAGDDQDGLEATIALCQRLAIPVFVVGVPAPFGRDETLVKWVDPDPAYDQQPQWGRVTQGPESCMLERIRLHFAGQREDTAPLDSGFGPYALTRLAYETGGIYFAVHPNRNVHRDVTRGETAPFSAHFQRFFDPDVMRKYRPDYVSREEYMRRAAANGARSALLAAAQLSWVTPLEDPVLRFVQRDEASFANALTEAQKQAARLAPQVARLHELLQRGEPDRDKELSPRWQAGFDLALGRVLAVRVRTEGYNAMLAQAKRGMAFASPDNNTWTLAPSVEVTSGSQLAKWGQQATEYLQRVTRDHPDTPWALLAQRELEMPMGWRWTESHTPLAPPRDSVASNPPPRPPAPADDTARMLPPPPPRRDPPRL